MQDGAQDGSPGPGRAFEERAENPLFQAAVGGKLSKAAALNGHQHAGLVASKEAVSNGHAAGLVASVRHPATQV